eukprot:SAG31_NODE_20344_length_577_cov_0.958159_1_plen_97_part_00
MIVLFDDYQAEGHAANKQAVLDAVAEHDKEIGGVQGRHVVVSTVNMGKKTMTTWDKDQAKTFFQMKRKDSPGIRAFHRDANTQVRPCVLRVSSELL